MAAPKVLTGKVSFVNTRPPNGGFKLGMSWCNYPDPWHGVRCQVGETIRVEVKTASNRVEKMEILEGGPAIPEDFDGIKDIRFEDDYFTPVGPHTDWQPNRAPSQDPPIIFLPPGEVEVRARVLEATARITGESEPKEVLAEAEEYLKWVEAGRL